MNVVVYALFVFVALSFSSINSWAQSSVWILKVSPNGAVVPARCTKIDMPLCIDGLTIETAIKLVGNTEWLARISSEGIDIRVEVAAGTYRIQSPLKVSWGRDLIKVGLLSISGPKGGDAIITGARDLTGFKLARLDSEPMRLPAQARGNVYSVYLGGMPGLNLDAPIERGFARPILPVVAEIFFREQVLPVARWPNQGYGKIRVAASVEDEKGAHNFGIEGRNAIDWSGEPDLIAAGYFEMDWAEEFIPVVSIDVNKNELVLSGTGPRIGIKPNRRIRILNAMSELDEPGEWYFDRKSALLYLWPPKPIQDGDVEISLLDNLMQFEGARNVQVSNLVFEKARGDAITVKNSENVEINHSVIRNVGNRAAIFIGGKNSGLRDVLIEQTGEGGVVLQGGNRTTLEPANLYVDHCQIRLFSRLSSTYRPAVWVEGVGNRIVGNVISDAPHSAIIFGGNDHLISFNDISHVVQETDDAGAIYAGRDWTKRGTVISNNFLHDIGNKNGHSVTMGVYLDDQTSGITVRGNVFASVPYPVFIGGGRDNLVEQNLMANSSPAIYLDARGLGWQREVTLDRNGALQKGLDAVPYNRPPYSDRYVHLANIREDDIGTPKYNIARCNVVVGGVIFDIEKAAVAGVLTVSNYVAGDSIFLKQIPPDARKNIVDFQLNPNALGLNGECWKPMIETMLQLEKMNFGSSPVQQK